MHDEHAVGGAAHVELDAVGAELAGLGERREGVLGPGVRRAPVAEDERTIGHRLVSLRSAANRNTFHSAARKSWSDPLPPDTIRPLACIRLGVEACGDICDRAHK